MAKAPQNESPADKLKREQLEAESKKEAERIANQTEDEVQQENGDASKEPPEQDPEVAEEAKKPDPTLVAAFEDPEPKEDPREIMRRRGEAARDKLMQIAQSYPVTTPNEHTIFGFGGVRFHLGDLRDLFGLNTRPN